MLVSRVPSLHLPSASLPPCLPLFLNGEWLIYESSQGLSGLSLLLLFFIVADSHHGTVSHLLLEIDGKKRRKKTLCKLDAPALKVVPSCTAATIG